MREMKLDIQMFANPKLIIETALDKKGFEKGLDKIQGIAKKGFQGVAVGVGVASTALAGFVGKSVQAAGELEQQIGGAEAVFKELGKTIDDIKFKSFQDAEGNVMSLKQVANDAYQTMGLSANDYMATLNKMGALMQGSGLDSQKSLDLSAQAMQRAADVASIMGIDVNDAMNSIAGAAKGNFTMMDNLGVAMNATTIEAYAMEKGLNKTYNEMTNAEKVEMAMQMFLEKSAYATGNYVKENKTFAGSFTTLKASIQNFMSGAGDIDAVIDSVMNFADILVESIGKMAPKIVEGIVKLIKGVIPQLPPLLKQLLPVVINGAVDLINGLVEALPTIIPILLDAIIMAVEKIVDVLPEIITALVNAMIIIVQALAEKAPVLIPKLVDAILEIIPILIDNLPLFLKAGAQLLLGLLQGILNSVPTLISRIPQIVASIHNAFSKIRNKMLNVGVNMIKGLWSGIKNVKQWLFDKIKDFAKGIVDKVKALFGIKSPSRVFRDQIGKNLALGIGEGFDQNIDDVYKQMQGAIDLEQGKLQASVETGRVFNSIQNSTPVLIDINADVEMDKQKVGRIITPAVSRTIKSGGGM